MKRAWFITGTSRGLGNVLCSAVLQHGDCVVATARNVDDIAGKWDEYGDNVLTFGVDVAKRQEVRQAVELSLKKFGRIDVLVNNAGYGLFGAVEEVSDSQISRQFETNVFGAIDVIRAVLPAMRAQRSGHIINISSVAGVVGYCAAALYCSTKFAIEGLTEALALEVAPLGIKVMLVEPGFFRTDFHERALSDLPPHIADYTPSCGEALNWVQSFVGRQPGNPIKAARAMISAVEDPGAPLRLPLGEDSRRDIAEKLQAMRNALNALPGYCQDMGFSDPENLHQKSIDFSATFYNVLNT